MARTRDASRAKSKLKRAAADKAAPPAGVLPDTDASGEIDETRSEIVTPSEPEDAEEMASGSVQEQLLYQKGLAENRIEDTAGAALEKAERARSRLSERTVPSTRSKRSGQRSTTPPSHSKRGGGSAKHPAKKR